MTSTETTTEPNPRASALRSYRPLQALVLVQLVVGVALGLVWLAWSPHSVAYNLDLGTGRGVIVPAEGESLVAADGRFVLLTAVPGVVFGLLAWWLRPLRGRVTLAALAVCSVLASVLTKYTGQLLSGGHGSAPINTAFRPHLVLHANAALFVQALLASLVYTIFVGLTGDPELGRPAEAAGPAGQAHSAGQARSAGPADPLV